MSATPQSPILDYAGGNVPPPYTPVAGTQPHSAQLDTLSDSTAFFLQLSAKANALEAKDLFNLDVADLLDFGGVCDGVTDDTDALNAAYNAGRSNIYIPGDIVISEEIVFEDDPVYLFGRPNTKSRITWGGAAGATMITGRSLVYGGMRDLILDGNLLADNGLYLDGCTYGNYPNLTILGFRNGSGLQMVGVAGTCSWNRFGILSVSAHNILPNGKACIWLGHDGATGSNACHNSFEVCYIEHGGTRDGIYLGNCDNNVFYLTFIQRDPGGTRYGVYADTTEEPLFPSNNSFFHLEAGVGGWVNASGGTLLGANRVYNYARDNGQPLPVTNDSPLILIDGTMPAWSAPTLSNGWANFGGSTRTAAYRRDYFGRVYLRGLIAGGTFADSTTLFTLPAGHRPAATEHFPVYSTPPGAEIIVLSDGQVKIFNATGNTNLALNGVQFSAVD